MKAPLDHHVIIYRNSIRQPGTGSAMTKEAAETQAAQQNEAARRNPMHGGGAIIEYKAERMQKLTIPAGWSLTETGGGCTAIQKEIGDVELLVTAAIDPSAPEADDEASVLGVYPPDAGSPFFEVSGPASMLFGFGDRFGFVDDGVTYFSFADCGSFLGVKHVGAERFLMHCPMNADGTPDRENLGEVENGEGIDFDDVNRLFGTTFQASVFGGR